MSIDKCVSTTPVTPPIANKNTNRNAHKQAVQYVIYTAQT